MTDVKPTNSKKSDLVERFESKYTKAVIPPE